MKKRLIIILCCLIPFGAISQNTERASVFADLLYWHASQQPSSTWANILLEPNLNPDRAPNIYFGWSPGFRAGVQYHVSEFFDTKLSWTYFSTDDHEAITATPGELIYSQFFNGFSTLTAFGAAQIDWKLLMNMIDVEAGHQINLHDSFNIRPFIGIKGGSINQRIHSQWSEHALIFDFSATENLKNNFYGVGPSFGLDSVWQLAQGFNLLGEFSTALMWGHWSIEDSYYGPSVVALLPSTTITSTTNDALGTLMLRYFTGLEWTHKEKTSVTIKAGYEMQYWTNQLRLPTFQQLPIHGDLTLQGATCGIYINFG